MPSLRIHFPEKETPTTVVLKGTRISIGRTPANTIQILDRTVSAKHAEFIAEADGHYRLHDAGSTNGTRVNSEAVHDFHLTEPCKIAFGNLECDFALESSAEASGGEQEVLPTRSEMEALRQVNGELRKNLDLLREEVESFKKVQAAGGDSSAVLSGELQRLILERAAARETDQRQAQEIDHLKSELALVKRDRINLENALRHANAENERLQKEQGSKPVVPVAPSTVPAATTPAPALTAADTVIAAPSTATAPAPALVPAASAPATAPTPPAPQPQAAPAPAPVPKPAPAPASASPGTLKAYPHLSKPAFPPPSAPSLSPAGPQTKPTPKFVPGSRPAAPAVPQKAGH